MVFHKVLHQICTKIFAPTQSKKAIKNSSVFFRFTLLSSHLKNEVIFKTFCYRYFCSDEDKGHPLPNV